MDHASANDLAAYERERDSGGVQNAGNYITIIPVEYQRRYPVQTDFQYGEYRSREDYLSVERHGLSGEVLYSVSQRLPPLSHSPVARHADWQEQGSLPDARQSNSCDSLDKSVMGSNLSSCSNQTGSSVAGGSCSTAEPVSTTGAVSPPVSGSSGSTVSSSSGGPSPVMCVYLMSRVAVMVEISPDEVLSEVTATRLLQAVLSSEELTLSGRPLPAHVFALWMCSPLLEVQLSAEQCPRRVWSSWQRLLNKFSSADADKKARDRPIIRMQRNVFLTKQQEESVKDWRVQRLLYEEARHNVVRGRYPLEASQAVSLGGLQATIQRGHLDPSRHTLQYFREHQDQYLPKHARSGRWARLLPPGGKGSPEARLLEHMQRAPAAASPRKLREKYLEFCRAHVCYGCGFFQGEVERPVRSLTGLLTQCDLPVLVAVNETGVAVTDDTRSDMLLALTYEQMCWELGLPSQESEDCLPCIFLQFMVVENGLRVSKILQVFSKQAEMIDRLIEHFAGEFRRKRGLDTPDRTQFDHYSECGISLPPLPRADSPARLASKLSRLSLATHDARGNAIGEPAPRRRPGFRLPARPA